MFKVYLDAVRTNAKMSQEDWANALSVTKATVTSWETGKTVPRLDQVQRMSELSGIPIDHIFMRTNPTISEQTKEEGTT